MASRAILSIFSVSFFQWAACRSACSCRAGSVWRVKAAGSVWREMETGSVWREKAAGWFVHEDLPWAACWCVGGLGRCR